MRQSHWRGKEYRPGWFENCSIDENSAVKLSKVKTRTTYFLRILATLFLVVAMFDKVVCWNNFFSLILVEQFIHHFYFHIMWLLSIRITLQAHLDTHNEMCLLSDLLLSSKGFCDFNGSYPIPMALMSWKVIGTLLIPIKPVGSKRKHICSMISCFIMTTWKCIR